MSKTSSLRFQNRRDFLRTAALSSLGFAFTSCGFAKSSIVSPKLSGTPLRIRGRVTVDGKGVGRVAVSDGMVVAQTENDGRYELVSTSHRDYAFISLPSGTKIPLNPSGTPRFYSPLSTGEDEIRLDWALKRSTQSDVKHGFLALADPQLLDDEDIKRFQSETVPDIQSMIKQSTTPLFAVSCGDLVFDRLPLMPDYEKTLSAIKVPLFQVLGNHDEDRALSDALSTKTFSSFFGPPYYSFNRGEIHYVVLDDILWLGQGYIGYVDDVQLEWLRQDLSVVEAGTTIVAFSHIPIYCTQHIREGLDKPSNSEIVTNRGALYEIFKPFKVHSVVGHMHELEHLTDGGIQHHVCGAVCGSWWTVDICGDGTPNGYAIFSASNSEISWSYKSTGYDLVHQLRTYPVGSDPKAPSEIVVNVWDADDQWNTVWIEDGIRKGKMSRRIGKDPLAVQLLQGKDKPRKHPWAEPYNTNHLFYAPVDGATREIVVEVTDRLGGKYSEKFAATRN